MCISQATKVMVCTVLASAAMLRAPPRFRGGFSSNHWTNHYGHYENQWAKGVEWLKDHQAGDFRGTKYDRVERFGRRRRCKFQDRPEGCIKHASEAHHFMEFYHDGATEADMKFMYNSAKTFELKARAEIDTPDELVEREHVERESRESYNQANNVVAGRQSDDIRRPIGDARRRGTRENSWQQIRTATMVEEDRQEIAEQRSRQIAEQRSRQMAELRSRALQLWEQIRTVAADELEVLECRFGVKELVRNVKNRCGCGNRSREYQGCPADRCQHPASPSWMEPPSSIAIQPHHLGQGYGA